MAKTIMIAANDPNLIYLLQRYAEESGFGTVKTGCGEDALTLAQNAKPAVIILEIELPGTKSWDILRWLKSEPTTHNIPIVVYSWLDEEVCSQVEGVAGYLQRSVLYDDFLAVLKQAGVQY